MIDQIWCSFTAKKHRQSRRQETHRPEAPQACAHSNTGICPGLPAQRAKCMHRKHLTRGRLVAAAHHALLVVAGGLIVGVNDGVGGHAVGVVGLFTCIAVSGPDFASDFAQKHSDACTLPGDGWAPYHRGRKVCGHIHVQTWPVTKRCSRSCTLARWTGLHANRHVLHTSAQVLMVLTSSSMVKRRANIAAAHTTPHAFPSVPSLFTANPPPHVPPNSLPEATPIRAGTACRDTEC